MLKDGTQWIEHNILIIEVSALCHCSLSNVLFASFQF